ncbi:FecR family protein [Spirosoma arcticum]
MNEHINKQRIFDYLAGKATALEKKQIDEWSRESAHEEQFYRWLDEWEQAHLQYTADQPKAFGQYYNFLYANQSGAPNPLPAEEVSSRSIRLFGRRSWLVWAVAASLTFMVGAFAFREQLLTRTYETAYGETRLVNLPDGSAVTLNSNSSLRIPRFGFGKQWFGAPWFGIPTREVRLTGEALFSVTHTTTNQQFVVKTANGPQVVVLGTEFTVFARPRGTKVVLNRGKVEVHYQQSDRQSKQVTMKPGDLVMLTPQGEIKHRQTHQPPANPAWTEHRFVFDKTPLTEIVAILGENYGLTAEIADAETGQMTISGAYSAQTADELLRIIAEVLNIDIDRKPNKLILTQKPLQ